MCLSCMIILGVRIVWKDLLNCIMQCLLKYLDVFVL